MAMPLLMVLPIGVAVCLAWCIHGLQHRFRFTRTSVQNRVYKGVSFIAFLMYPGLSTRLFQFFKCREMQGSFYLEADYRVQCYEGSWNAMMILAIAGMALYVFGIPCVTFVLLW